MPDSIRTKAALSGNAVPVLGKKVRFNIPRTADLEKLLIIFSGTITNSVAATSLITDGILNLITNVSLEANSGRTIIASMPFSMLVKGSTFPQRKRGKSPALTNVGVTAAAHVFRVATEFSLASFGTVRPKDTSLREGDYESLSLVFQFAPTLVDYVYEAGTSVATTLDLEVMAAECVELKDAAGKYSSPTARVSESANDIDFSGASSNVAYKLAAGQGLRGIVLRVQSTATPPVLSDTLLKDVTVRVGKVERISKLTAAMIKDDMSTFIPSASLPGTGYFVIDFMHRQGSDENLTDALDLMPENTNGADSEIIFGTTAACKITMLQKGYVSLAAAK